MLPMQTPMQRRQWLTLAGAGISLGSAPAFGQGKSAWERVTSTARGQKLYFHTPGRNDPLNAHLQWVSAAMQEVYGVQMQHVRTETDSTLERIQNEVAQERLYGTVDMVSLAGPTLARALRQELLFGPLGSEMPNLPLLDAEGKPAIMRDGGLSIQGMVIPWGLSQLTFWLDGKRFPKAPATPADLLTMARSTPGGFTYPRPSDPVGLLFLVQLLWSLAPERDALYRAPGVAARAAGWARVWEFLDALHPHLWRQGKDMPGQNVQLQQMMYQGEVAMALSIQPSEAVREIAARRLPATSLSFQLREGTLAQAHCVGIPINARSKAAALCLANFLISPEAQGRKSDPADWGDLTVLNTSALNEAQRRRFGGISSNGALASSAPAVPLPHGGWSDGLEQAWTQRYASR